MKRSLLSLFVFSLLAVCAVPLKAQTQVHSNTLKWAASPTTAVLPATIGYNVWKQSGCAGTFVKVNTVVIPTLTFVDTGMIDGEVNCYSVTTVLTESSGVTETTVAQSETTRCVTPSVTPPTAKFVLPPGKATVNSI